MPDSQGKIVGISVPVVPWHKDATRKPDPRAARPGRGLHTLPRPVKPKGKP